MLLIAGIRNEDPVHLVIESAKKASVPFLFLDQTKLSRADFNIHLDNKRYDATLFYEGSRYNLFDFTGIYYRFIESPNTKDKDTLQKLRLFDFWLETATCPVMNKSSAQISNASKPYQYQLIQSAGFMIPQTLITNSPDAVTIFKKNHKRLIFKSISSIRSIVSELDAVKMLNMDRIKYLPTQFQQLLVGKNVRVHVVGTKIFASEIITNAIDYRYAHRDDLDCEIKQIQLDPQIEKRCLDLSSLLNLRLCGIDLMITREGIFCFEVNPSPGFSYYQGHTGQDISGEIIQYLSGKK